MWSPLSNILRLQEGIGTGPNGITVSWSGTSTRNIQNVTYTSNSGMPIEMSVTWGGSSFNFKSTFVTIFKRGIHYVTEEGIVGQNMTYEDGNYVGNYTLLPDNFYAAYIIESPNPSIVTLTFTITGQETTESEGEGGGTGTTAPFVDIWSCFVEHDYDANIVAVKYAISKSDALKRYQEKRGT